MFLLPSFKDPPSVPSREIRGQRQERTSIRKRRFAQHPRQRSQGPFTPTDSRPRLDAHRSSRERRVLIRPNRVRPREPIPQREKALGAAPANLEPGVEGGLRRGRAPGKATSAPDHRLARPPRAAPRATAPPPPKREILPGRNEIDRADVLSTDVPEEWRSERIWRRGPAIFAFSTPAAFQPSLRRPPVRNGTNTGRLAMYGRPR